MAAFLALVVPAVAAGTYGVGDIPNVQRADRMRFTSNPDGILSAGAVACIDSICASLRDRGIAEVAVVAVDDIAGDDVFTFAHELFSTWGVGDAERDNGLGILLVAGRREVRFVTGYGVEGILPDAVCKRIQLQYMLPRFRQGDYDSGMVAGVGAAALLLEGSELPAAEGRKDMELPWTVFLVFGGFVGILSVASAAAYRRNRRCPRCGRLSLRLRSARSTSERGVSEYTFVCTHCGETVRRRRRDNHHDGFGAGPGAGGGVFMGGGFGGLGGGMGGGFGGGGFGGGGAGSRW